MPVEATEGSFPDSTDNLELIPAKIGAIQFRVHGLLDRILAAVKSLAALITRMENRAPGPPPGPADYPPPNQAPWVYYGDREPTPREPSWLKPLFTLIVAPLIVLGIPSILITLWTIKSDLSNLQGDKNLIIQRLDQQDAHMRATDAQVEEIKREIWPHKH